MEACIGRRRACARAARWFLSQCFNQALPSSGASHRVSPVADDTQYVAPVAGSSAASQVSPSPLAASELLRTAAWNGSSHVVTPVLLLSQYGAPVASSWNSSHCDTTSSTDARSVSPPAAVTASISAIFNIALGFDQVLSPDFLL